MQKTLNRIVTGALLKDIGKIVCTVENNGNIADCGKKYLRENGIVTDNSVLNQIGVASAEGLENDSVAYITLAAFDITRGMRQSAKHDEKLGGARLNSIFNLLNADKQKNGRTDLKYGSSKLSQDINMPSADSGECDITVLREFLDVLKKQYKFSDTADNANLLLKILESYLVYIPSYNNSDISLHDSSKLTAAIATCIFQYLYSKNITDYNAALFKNKDVFYAEKAFILYSMDLSGIQDFIYSITSDGALKALRARSFYLELLMEHLVDTLLKNTGASRANCIYTGGGHAYILLANTDRTIGQIEEFERQTNDGLLDIFGTALCLAGGYAPFSADEILDEKSPHKEMYKGIFRQVSNKISERKIHRYDAGTILKLNESPTGGGLRECSVCRSTDKLKGDKCGVCTALENFSKDIQDDKEFFVIVGVKSDGLLPLPGGVYLRAATKDELRKIKCNPNCGYRRSYSKNDFQTKDPEAVNLWVGDYRHGDTFKDIADNVAGIKRLGVFRADIDNLGQAFVSGFQSDKFGAKYISLERTAAFSRSLSLFFKAYINGILENGDYSILGSDDKSKFSKRNATIVYSGGDDVFVIGAWDDIIGFAVDLYNKFKEYTQGRLTISAGIGIYPVKYPVSAMAKETGGLEDCSKNHKEGEGENATSKNAVTLFDESNTYSWDVFIQEVLGEKYKLISEFFDAPENKEKMYGKSFLYRLLELMRNSGDKLNLARYAYLLARMEPNQKDSNSGPKLKELYDKFSRKMYEWIRDNRQCKQAITAIYIYLYTKRMNENEPIGGND